MLIYNRETHHVSQAPLRMPQDHEIVWINLLKPSTDEINHVLLDMFQCHPLLIEDCIKQNQRPKLDQYRDQVLITFYTLAHTYKPIELDIVVGTNYIVTMCQHELPLLNNLTEEFQRIEGRLDHTGRILYSILDRCVDQFIESINEIENKLEHYEQAIYQDPYVKISQQVFRQKRALHRIRSILADEKMLISAISHQEFPYTKQETHVYYMDIYDHISRAIDSIDIFRESLNSLMEMQMSMKSDRMNEIMKTLTIFSAIFLPLMFLSGLYGMNFEYMPELKFKFSYPIVLVIMAIVAGSLYYYFKRKKWL